MSEETKEDVTHTLLGTRICSCLLNPHLIPKKNANSFRIQVVIYLRIKRR